MISSIGFKIWFIFLLLGLIVVYSKGFYDSRCNLIESHCENGCETCSESQPHCYSRDEGFEEFNPHDMNSTCKMLFLDKYKMSLMDDASGTLNLTFLISKSKGRKLPIITIDLKIIENNTDNSSSSLHSSKCVRLSTANSCSAHQVIPVQFRYLFTGTYQLEIYEKNSNMKCRTKPFSASFSYQKAKLNEVSLNVLPRNLPQSASLLVSGVELPEKLRIMLYSSSISCVDNEKWKKSGSQLLRVVVLDSYRNQFIPGGPCCDYIEIENNIMDCCTYDKRRMLDHCPCSWDESHQLDCNFSNISTGNYCVFIEFSDPRCALGTYWTAGGKRCSWRQNIVASGNKANDTVVVQPNETSNYWDNATLLIIFGLITVVCVILYIYKRRGFKNSTHFLSDCNNSKNIPDNAKNPMRYKFEKFIIPEVLLLYPRDCDPLMKVIAGFRDYLRCSNFTVYDPWDEEIYDEVVESFDSWAFPMIKNENVKIILVLSECSKMFEKAFLNNYTLEYSEPHILDVIFSQSLATIHQYFSKRYDSYQRIFVIRLTGLSILNFQFITPATAYSIPSNMEQLLNDLTSGRMKDMNCNTDKLQCATLAWRESIKELEEFLGRNKSYLMELISKEKILTK